MGNPILQRQQARSALAAQQAAAKTFAWCARHFIEAKSPEWSNTKDEQQWTNTLETYAIPRIRRLLVADVGTAQVLEVLKPIWQTKRRRPPQQAAVAQSLPTLHAGPGCALDALHSRELCRGRRRRAVIYIK